MKFILVPTKPLPKQLSANHRPQNLGEMKQAFLNANNKRSWAQDEEYPEPTPRKTGWLFKSYRQVKEALKWQRNSLKKKERRRFLASQTATLTFQGPHRLRPFEEMIEREITAGWITHPPEMVALYMESLYHKGDVLWLEKMNECRFDRSTGHVTHQDDFRWDRGDKPRVFEQLMQSRRK